MGKKNTYVVLDKPLKERKEAFLKFLNWLLVNHLDRDKIKSFEEFKDIGKDELEEVEFEEHKDEWIDILFPSFDKYKFGFYRRAKNPCYLLTILKKCCMYTDFALESKEIITVINGKRIGHDHYYFINTQPEDE